MVRFFITAKFKNILSTAIFSLAMIFIFVSAWHSFNEPLERDITSYAYIAHSMLSGDDLYTDLWDHKPPGIHLAFAMAELVWGYDQVGIVMLWVVVTMASMFFIFLILNSISNLTTGLLGVALWALSANSLHLQANQINTEAFLNLFSLIAIWSVIQYELHRNTKSLHIAGWAIGLATMFKPIAIFVLFAIIIYRGFNYYHCSHNYKIKSFLRESAILVYPMIVLWVSLFSYALMLNRFGEYWNILINYNSQYSGNTLVNIWLFFNSPNYLFNNSLTGIWVLVMPTCAWLFLGSRSKMTKMPHSFIVIITFGILFETASAGKTHPHYYQTYLPLATICTSLMTMYLIREIKTTVVWRWISGTSLGVVCFTMLVFHQYSFFKLTPDEISVAKYGTQYIESKNLGLLLLETTNPEDLIYYWGSESGVYYYSKLKSASGVFYNLPMRSRVKINDDELMKRLLNDLQNTPPALFIWNMRDGDPENHQLSDFLGTKYQRIGYSDHFMIYSKNEDAYEYQ